MRVSPTLSILTGLLISVAFGLAPLAEAQSEWRTHDLNRPTPPIVTPGAQNLPATPPSDAIVLFDGSSLDGWVAMDGSPTKWKIENGEMISVAGAGYIRTEQGFGDVQLHIEWAAPTPVEGSSQGRGNSGVFLMGLYEIQVLDSYGNVTYADGQAASVYGQNPPMVNAARPPGEWQSYDIIFHRPRFGQVGELVKPARVTVLHNGVLVQDNFKLWGGTGWLEFSPYETHADRLPLAFQDHGNPVRYRNVWVRDLEAAPMEMATMIAPEPTIHMTHDELDRYVGEYRVFGNNTYRFEREGDELVAFIAGDDPKPVAIHSKTHFSLVKTAGDLQFELDDDGNPTQVTFILGGSPTRAKRIN